MIVTVRPKLLQWARERASLAPAELAVKVGTKAKPAPIEEWEQTGTLPLKKLEVIAARTHAPFAALFLDEPPAEQLPIKDFRRGVQRSERPRLNLLQTVYDCQFRQDWMSSHLESEGADPLPFVGSASAMDAPEQVANSITARLRIGVAERGAIKSPAEATLWFMERLDGAGILIQRNGVVGNQTRRSLDPEEFKGFALCDRFAPLIFVNANDWAASQMFTMAHECAHIWIGESGLPDGDWFAEPDDPVERFCNRVAAQVLMPQAELERRWDRAASAAENTRRLSRVFQVSGLALLIRGRSLDILTEAEFQAARRAEEQAFAEAKPKGESGGGNFYNTAKVRLGRRFIREVVGSTLEGKTLYNEAFELLGTRKTSVVQGLAERFLHGGGS